MKATDYSNRTALHFATAEGNIAITAELLSDGANVPARDRKERRPALHMAAEHGNTTALALLLDRGANVDEQDAAGKSALHIATEHEKV